ncbi:disease resistance protein RPV1-like [Populus alba]|uniref:disease resistance protein RPV1-like n=1 Tax=Populus alba TaxID=43335 RepID=UPI003CC773CF
MTDVKFLQLNYTNFHGSFEHFPKNLIWLCWHGLSSRSIPNHVCLEKLAVLDLSRSCLVDAWKGKLFLPKLKVLDLRHSRDLIRTPNFSGLPALEKLILEDCIRLVQIHNSIGDLQKLLILNLRNCTSLMELPEEMVLGDGYEAQFVQYIVENVSKNLDSKIFYVPLHFIGRDPLVQYINSWLQDGSHGVAIALLYGIGGVGKTAIAKSVFNQNYYKFEGKSFLSNFRSKDIVCLQRAYPVDGFVEDSWRIVHHCNGLPIALGVIGSSLSGKGREIWESALQQMEIIPNFEVQKVLRISYDYLDGDYPKNLFLDIACFFNGMDVDDAVRLLDGLDKGARFGIDNLIDRWLVEINSDQRLWMHQLVRAMGREIARQESPKCQRIWHHGDAFTVLQGTTDAEKLRGLTIDMHALMEYHYAEVVCTDSMVLSRLNFFQQWLSDFFDGGKLQTSQTSLFPILSADAFRKMTDVKFLQLNYTNFHGSFEHFPKNLIWLSWHGLSLSSIPNHICLEKLVVLDLSRSCLVDAWKGKLFLPKLKVLDLRQSRDLIRTLDFSSLPALEKLILEDCIRLITFDHGSFNVVACVFDEEEKSRWFHEEGEEDKWLIQNEFVDNFSFKISSPPPTHRICGFNLFISCVTSGYDGSRHIYLEIRNNTSCRSLRCQAFVIPMIFKHGVREFQSLMHRKLEVGDPTFDNGDDVSISVLRHHPIIQIRRIGVQWLHEEEGNKED